MIKRLASNRFIQSSAIFSIISFMVSVVGYVVNLLIARSFSLADYGEYMSAISYTIFLGVPLTAFGLVVIKRVGRSPIEERIKVALAIEKWIWEQIQKNFLLLVGSVLVLSGLLYFKGNMAPLTIAFIFLTAFLSIFSNFYSSILQSYKWFGYAGGLLISVFVTKLFLVLGVSILNPQLLWLFTAFIMSGLVHFFLGRKMIRGKIKETSSATAKTKSKEIKFFSPKYYLTQKSILIPLLTTLGLIGLINADVVLVKKFFESDVAGLYASLSLLGKIILYLAAPLSMVAFSFFTGSESKHQSNKIVLVMTLVLGILGVGSVLGYALFPNLIIKIVFGEKFLGVQDLVWMSAVFGSLYALINFYGQALIAMNSRMGLLALLAVVFQIGGIYIFHNSLYQVLWVNIVVSLVLVCVMLSQVFNKVSAQ